MGLMDRVKSAAGAVADKVGEACAGGVEMAQATLADVSAASADLSRVGYRVTAVEVQVGVPPGVTVFLVKERDATDEQFAAVLADHADSTAACLLIRLVQQADRWALRLRVMGRCCRQVAVDLGVRPGVRLLYPTAEGVAAAGEANAQLEATASVPAEAAAAGAALLPYSDEGGDPAGNC